MASRKSKARRKTAAKRPAAARRDGNDAIALLKADHRQVEAWFEQFGKSRSDEKKLDLAGRICTALIVHTAIEEEVFYPAFIAVVKDADLHHEAIIEHDAAKKLIADIQASGPDDDFFDAKLKVLSEMIKHHVKEEEQPGGMFAEARKSRMDLHEIGAQMEARKGELEAQIVAAPARANGGILSRIVEAGSR
jgi:hemerythrin superfamily protein